MGSQQSHRKPSVTTPRAPGLEGFNNTNSPPNRSTRARAPSATLAGQPWPPKLSATTPLSSKRWRRINAHLTKNTSTLFGVCFRCLHGPPIAALTEQTGVAMATLLPAHVAGLCVMCIACEGTLRRNQQRQEGTDRIYRPAFLHKKKRSLMPSSNTHAPSF